jgi:DNA-binding FadR family transcriptional regulator
MSGNRLYEAILASLLALTHEIVRVVKPPHQLIHNHEEHGAIVEAVLSGDPDTAALAMKEHLRSVGHALVRLERQYREKTGRMGLSVPSETVSEHPLS